MAITPEIQILDSTLWTPDTGTNYNALNPTQFMILFNRLPNFTFSCQTIEIPSVSISGIPLPNPYIKNQTYGEKLEFSNLSMTVILDSKMKAYAELSNWLKDMTTVGKAVAADSEATLLLGEKSEISFRFVGIWPTRIGDVKFYSTPGIVEYALCDVDFNYDVFYIEKLAEFL